MVARLNKPDVQIVDARTPKSSLARISRHSAVTFGRDQYPLRAELVDPETAGKLARKTGLQQC